MKKFQLFVLCLCMNSFVLSMNRSRQIAPQLSMSLEELRQMNDRLTQALNAIEARKQFLEQEVLTLEYTDNSNCSPEFHARFDRANYNLGEAQRCSSIVSDKERRCLVLILVKIAESL